MVDDLKKGYYLLFIDGGKRATEQGQAEGAIGVILQEPDCGPVLATVAEKAGRVGSPHEAEYPVCTRAPNAVGGNSRLEVRQPARPLSCALSSRLSGVFNRGFTH